MAKHNLDELEKISSDPLTVEIINLIGCEITATKTHYYSMLAKEREVDTDDIRKDEIFAMMMVREMMYGYCQIMDEIYGPTDDSIWELLILSEANLSDDIDVQKIKNGLNNPNLSESIIDEVKKLKTLVSVIYESWHSVDWVLPIIDEIQGQEQLNSDDLVSTIVSNIQKQLYADGIFGDDSFSEVMDETIDEVQARKQLIGLREKILKIEKDIVRERGILRKSLLDLILVYKPRTIEDLKNAISVFWDSIDHRQDKYLQDIVDITKNITD